jgi:DNA-binding transcriptional ArsR family regulator
MLRIVFSRDDVARTRLAPAPDPLWEIVLSLHLLQGSHAEPQFGPWRRAVRRDLRESGLLPRLRLLVGLVPQRGYFPDFLTPAAGLLGLDAGLDALRATPASVLGHDLTLLALEHPLPTGALPLASGEQSALRNLTETIAAYHRLAVEPYWSDIQAAYDADRCVRTRAMAEGGTEALLAGMRPAMRWSGGELCVDYPVDQDLHLDNRGLVLVPSYFCWQYPVTLLEPSLPPVLVYPVERPELPLAGPGPGNPAALAALLGATRAQVLGAVGDGRSTSDLARRTGVSVASASQHLTVLRNAGLVVSRRDRNMVLHTLTPLGQAMLEAG